MKRRKNKIPAVVVLLVFLTVLVIVSTGFISLQKQDMMPEDTKELTIITLDDQKSSFVEVYAENYQNQVHETIQELKKSYCYDISNPLLIENPYQTVTNGLYVYFETDKGYQVEYVIAAEGYNDFVQRVPTDTNNCPKAYEFLMVGMIMGEKNHITINLLDQTDQVVKSVSFEYECPKALGQFNVNRIEVNKGQSLTPVSPGLYVVLGNDNKVEDNENQQEEAYISMYDNDGVLRVEIPVINSVSYRLLFDENGMYFNVSKSRLVRMDRTGYVNWVYRLDNLFLHHDYLLGNRGDIVVLGSDNSQGTVEDVIFSIDLKTKEVRTIVDLKKLLPNYYQLATKPENCKNLDWMHINSFSFVADESIILSSRETSTIIKLDSIYDTPTIDYMIGSENFWKGTGYEQYLLKQEGEFSLHAGQHAVTYLEDLEETNQYYIYLYNNNNTISNTRPCYNWREDPAYKDTGKGIIDNLANSYHYKYLVDLEQRTFTLVNRIAVDYSGYVSGTQEYNDNVIINSGFVRTTWEYDSNGELIQELKVIGNNCVYRMYKYDFEGYWFQNNRN